MDLSDVEDDSEDYAEYREGVIGVGNPTGRQAGLGLFYHVDRTSDGKDPSGRTLGGDKELVDEVFHTETLTKLT